METGKTGKYLKYAIGEIVLVVIGILIALQINNWNQDRQERIEEHLVLTSLYNEFLESRELFNKGQSHHKIIFNGMQYLLKLLDENRVNENLVDSIYISLNTSAWSSGTFEPSRGIVNSLINSGKQNIISNDELKSHLIKWNDLVISYQNTERLAQEYKFTYLFPTISKLTKLPSKLKRSEINARYDISTINKGHVDLKLLQSKMFYNYLNQCWNYSESILIEGRETSRGKKINEALNTIILLIEKELKNK
jgi:hypothetical protein